MVPSCDVVCFCSCFVFHLDALKVNIVTNDPDVKVGDSYLMLCKGWYLFYFVLSCLLHCQNELPHAWHSCN